MLYDLRMPTVVRNLTDMLRSSGDVLRETEHQDVVLRRRDGADVMLVDLEREQGIRDSFAAAARILAGFANASDELLESLGDSLPGAVAWTEFLPRDERLRFLRDFVTTAAACVEADVFTPLARVNNEWRATAAVHADPDIVAVLRQPGEDDLGPVPRPRA